MQHRTEIVTTLTQFKSVYRRHLHPDIKKKINLPSIGINRKSLHTMSDSQLVAKTKKLIQNAGYAINTGENPLSLFALDCLSLHTTLFIEKKMINSKFKNIKKLLVPINFKNTKLSKNKIIRYIKKNKLQFHSRDFSNLKKISKNFNEEFKSYLKKNF